MESLSDKVAKSKAWKIIKNRLQHRYFPVNIAKSFRASILKIICILVYEMFFEYSVVFIAQIHHYEKFMTLHKIISIVL